MIDLTMQIDCVQGDLGYFRNPYGEQKGLQSNKVLDTLRHFIIASEEFPEANLDLQFFLRGSEKACRTFPLCSADE